MDILTQTMQAIGALSEKINDINSRLDDIIAMNNKNNKEAAEDAQNATCDLSIELEERITKLENLIQQQKGM